MDFDVLCMVAKSQTFGDMTPNMVRTEGENNVGADDLRRRVKEKLYKAKATGELTEDDEAEILRYAVGVVSRRGQKPRD